MIRCRFAGILLGTVALVLSLPGLGWAQRGGFNHDEKASQENGWLSGYRQGLDQARKLRKPMMLVFRCVP